jgi:hypothetical protein
MASKIVGIALLVLFYLAGIYFGGLFWPLKVLMKALELIVYSAISIPLLVVHFPSLAKMLFAFIADAVIEHGAYFTLMVAGWTAWVCFCALLYTVAEWLISQVLRRSRANG